jgi:hypothetical protein
MMDRILYLGRGQGLEVLIWPLVTIAAWWAFARYLRRAPAPGRLAVTYAIAAGVACSTAALAFSVLVFNVLRAHPTVQLNAPDDRILWSLWGQAWPWWFFGLPILAVVMLGVTIYRIRTETPGVKMALALALLQVGFSWLAVVGSFPSV